MAEFEPPKRRGIGYALPMRPSIMRPTPFYLGLFLMTACTLMLQVIQTRILSVVTWYHLAFVAISMAMFGLTAGAVWVYLRRERFTEQTLSYDLSYFSSAFALTTAVCLSVQMSLAPSVPLSVTAIATWAVMALCMSLPFCFAGIVVTLALTRSRFPIGRVYGVDLLGAAAGSLGVLLLLNRTDGPSAVLWVAAIGAAGAVAFARSGVGGVPMPTPPLHGLLAWRAVIFGVLAICAAANGLTTYGLQPVVAKGRVEHGGSHILREWNTFSRVAVYRTKSGTPLMLGPSPRFYQDRPRIEQRIMEIDSDAGTVVYRFNGQPSEWEFLKYDVTNLAYHLPGRQRAAIIGVGGGRDVLSAAVFGIRDITGIEINPIFVDLILSKPGFREFANLTGLDGLKLIVDEGRTWLARTGERFDVIQMSLIDTWAATGAGAFSLTENGLYTIDAWKTFLDKLSPAGVYTVSRWYNPKQPLETGRMLSLAVAALFESGVSEPRRHIFLATQKHIATLILARSPWSPADLAVLEDAVAAHEHHVLVSPSVTPESQTLARIVTATSRGELDAYTSTLAFDLTAPTDDRPFFFNQLPLNKPLAALAFALKAGLDRKEGVWAGNLVATSTLIVLFLVSLLLVVTTIVVPLRPAIKHAGRTLALGGTTYFLLIGIGFMMAEIGLLQRASVFLGHPVYSLSVLLFTLILATGTGSVLSDYLPLRDRRSLACWALLTAGYILALSLWLPRVFLALSAADLVTKAMVCVAAIAPGGLLMGFGFPTGMRLVSAVDRTPAPWFWGINGAAGVLASIVAVACSIAYGIHATLAVASICYLLLIPSAFGLLGAHERLRRDAADLKVASMATAPPVS